MTDMVTIEREKLARIWDKLDAALARIAELEAAQAQIRCECETLTCALAQADVETVALAVHNIDALAGGVK